MAQPTEPVETAERLVFFTDAVVAIALTLLVLPLVELVPEAERSGEGLGELLRDNLAQLGAFLLSFVVIFRFWWAHHRLFRHVSALSGPLVVANVVWTLSIVFLPVPTAIIVAYPPSPGAVALYIGTLVLTSGSLSLLAFIAHRNPALSAGRTRETREEVLGSSSALVVLVVALVLGTALADSVNYFALLLLFFAGLLERLVKRHWARAGSPSAPKTSRDGLPERPGRQP